MTKALIKITDMHCTACAVSIDLDLEETPGITSSKTNYAKSQTEVEYDEKIISPQKILDTIKTSGYTGIIS